MNVQLFECTVFVQVNNAVCCAVHVGAGARRRAGAGQRGQLSAAIPRAPVRRVRGGKRAVLLPREQTRLLARRALRLRLDARLDDRPKRRMGDQRHGGGRWRRGARRALPRVPLCGRSGTGT